MSQFGGGGKPGAWGRPGAPSGAPISGFGGLGGVGSFPMMGVGGLPMINQTAFSQPGMLGNMGIMGAVPGQQRPAPAPMSGLQSTNVQNKSRTFVGVVTKMHDSYGFVDDDVFFQHSVIRGQHPRVGDKVMVEATFNANMPFKWNAFRVQLLSGAEAGGQKTISPKTVKPPGIQPAASRWTPAATDRNGGAGRTASPARRRSPSRRSSPPRRASPPRAARRKTPPPAVRRSPRKSPAPRESRKRERSVHSETKKDSMSPPRRRARIIPRYECRTVKPMLTGDNVSLVNVRNRYSKLYVPSDFVQLNADWAKRVPLDATINMTNPVSFHIWHKDVDGPNSDKEVEAVLEPDDVDLRYQVKVLLMSHPGKQEILKKAFGLQADGTTDDLHEVTSVMKHIQFLVGTRGKEQLAIGGPWSPSLDGPDPTNPATLIKTAIRTTKALTGLDLSSVPQWYSMLELRYYRSERDRVDRVHLLWPDTQLLMPADDETWQAQCSSIQSQLETKLAANEAQHLEEAPPTAPKEEEPEVVAVIVKDETKVEPAAATEPKKEEKDPDEEPMTAADEEELKALQKPKPKASHWNDLDVKTMKVAELKQELEARGLESRGIKTLLAQRLQEALDKEQELEEDGPAEAELVVLADDTEDEKMDTSAVPVKTQETKSEEDIKKENEEYQKKLEQLVKDKKEKKERLEKHFALPKEQKVFIYPSKIAKEGKFDCKLMSLSSLLDYRQEDNKEGQFEVSLFAEAFKDLLDRQAVFQIYHAIINAGDKEAERARRDEAKKEKSEDAAEAPAGEEKDKAAQEEKKTTEKVDLKAVIGNRALFEAFAMFDINLCSYVTEKDLSELLVNAEIGVSRGQATKIAHKWNSRERVTYRYLTDNLVDSDGTIRFQPNQIENPISVEDLVKVCGNNFGVNEFSTQSSSERAASVGDDGTIVIDGNVININQKLALLKKCEQERDAAKLALEEQNALVVSLREAKQENEKKRKDADKELEKTKKKLHDVSATLKTTEDETKAFKNAMADVKRYTDRIITIHDKVCPPPPKKEEKKEKEKEKSHDIKKEKSDKGEEEEIPAVLVLSDEAGPETEADATETVEEASNDSTAAQESTEATTADENITTETKEEAPSTEQTTEDEVMIIDETKSD